MTGGDDEDLMIRLCAPMRAARARALALDRADARRYAAMPSGRRVDLRIFERFVLSQSQLARIGERMLGRRWIEADGICRR
jgi:hypothetical protein